MSVNDQVEQTISGASVKDAWFKPEIISFAPAVEAQGAGTNATDGSPGNLS